MQGQEVCAQALRKHRENLAALAGGGQAKQYFGKEFTVDQIDALDDAEIVKLFARYEARLGAAMTKTLGPAALQLYAGVASMFFQIENQPALVADLKAEPFVGHAFNSATCELYHRYSMFLAPLTATLTTMKHCQFGHQCSQTINDDGEPTNGGKVERVTDPAVPDPVPGTTKTTEQKTPKKKELVVPALPPERPKCSKRFGQPRNHFVVRLSIPAGESVFLQRKQTRNMQTNGPMFLLLRNNRNITVKDELTRSHGS